MSEPEPQAGVWMAFKQDLNSFLDRHPIAKFSFLLLFLFAFFSFGEAIVPWSDQPLSYARHVFAVAWRCVTFSIIFFFVFKRQRKAQE